MIDNPHIGSSVDSFLEEEGTLADINSIALKRVIVWQIQQAMAQKNLTKAAMAKPMKTSRSSLERLLDPQNPSVTLDTLERAARAVGKQVRLELVDPTIEVTPTR